MFTLQLFSSQTEFAYGDPIEVWARLSNHTNQTLDISHGPALIEYAITDENGLRSQVLHSYELLTTTFQGGDEFNSTLNNSHFFFYQLDYKLQKHEYRNLSDLSSLMNKAVRPSILPRGSYTITAIVNYSTSSSDQRTSFPLEVSIPLIIY